MAIDKSKMKCNSPKRQVQGGKKFVVKACKGGKEKMMGFFVGQVMKMSKGKANPAQVNELIRNKMK